MKIKYQIFVSSTFEDLKDERAQVVKAILEMGHIPVGMEMFSAGDEEQWAIIERQILETDYYVVLVAHRYGSTTGGLSFTEKEYDTAKRCRVPVLGFVIDDSASWPVDRVDTVPEKVEALKSFKEKVKQKLVSFWSSSEDLHGKVSIALMKQMNANPRIGWVSASQVAPIETTAELARLSGENAELRRRLSELTTQVVDDQREEQEKLLRSLRASNVTVSFYYINDNAWSKGSEESLYRIFSLIAPEMLIEKSTIEIARYLGIMLNTSKKKLRSKWPVPSNSVKSWIADFVALELVEASKKKHQIKDTEEYWTLSDKGRAVLAQMRKARLLAGLEIDRPKESLSNRRPGAVPGPKRVVKKKADA